MKKTNTRKLIAGTSAIAMATGMAATLGMGAANAAPLSTDWSDGDTSFIRTVSNTTPKVGDTITMSTSFIRPKPTAFNDEYVYQFKDLHPSCLTYVPGSITWNGQAQSDDIIVDREQSIPGSPSLGFIKTEVGKTKWRVHGGGQPSTVSLDYRVNSPCARNTPLTSGMHYSGSRGEGIYNNKGPAITVQADPTTPGGGNGSGNGDGETATGSLGSLGSIFGSLG